MKQLRAFLGLLIVAAFFYTAWKVVPPYMNDYEFQDAVAQVARDATFNRDISEDTIRDRVGKKAMEMGIPLTGDQIHIGHNGPEVIITGDYSIHVDLPVHPVDLSFHLNTKKI